MKIAVMQPYFFPYIGYFQLVDSVDLFIFLDDVNFIKRGWINRNNLIFNNNKYLFSIPLANASQNTPINKVCIARDNGGEFFIWRNKIRQSLELYYKDQPFYGEGLALLNDVLGMDTDLISDLAMASIIRCSRLLGIDTKFVAASEVDPVHTLKGADRIIHLCRQHGGDIYINPPGGRGLYEPEPFQTSGIQLNFLKPALKPYVALKRETPPGLSILDAIMCCGSGEVGSELLHGYEVEVAI